jgi:DNA-binding CsgD family transcriptional regulator
MRSSAGDRRNASWPWSPTSKPNGQIATELGLARETVKKYVSAILVKLEIARRAKAAAYLAPNTTLPGT